MAERGRFGHVHDRHPGRMMDAVLPFVAVWFAWSILAGCAHWLRAGPFRKLVVTSMLLTSCSLVFWVWDHSAWLRGLAVIPVILLLGKSWLVGARRTPWLPDSPTPGQFVLWCIALPEGRFVAEVEARQALRRSSALEAVRGGRYSYASCRLPLTSMLNSTRTGPFSFYGRQSFHLLFSRSGCARRGMGRWVWRYQRSLTRRSSHATRAILG